MSSVYVIKRLKNGKRYIGSTRKNPEQRLKEHNQKSSKWTSQNGPFELFYKEFFLNYSEARKRELFLKSGQGRKFLDNLEGA